MAKVTVPEDELLEVPPVPDQAQTVAALLTASRRVGAAVPVRATFLQGGPRGKRVPGPLAGFVKTRDEIGLELFLLALAAASAPPHDVVRPTEVWLRALGRSRTKSSVSVMSRAWSRLDERGLIERGRKGRLIELQLCREDGSGEPYSYPTGAGNDVYFKLPFAYWTEGLNNRLSLRGKAMLLIALSLPDGFVLPYERAAQWYGVSADTAQRGLRELENNGLVSVRTGYKRAPLTAQGWTEERRYTVAGWLRSARTGKARKKEAVSAPAATKKKAARTAPRRLGPQASRAPSTSARTATKKSASGTKQSGAQRDEEAPEEERPDPASQ